MAVPVAQFLPVRGLGEIGVIKDVGSFDLPPNGFSDARNVRFLGKKIVRAPLHEMAHDFTTANVEFCTLAELPDETDKVVICQDDGQIDTWRDGVVTDVTPPSWLPLPATVGPYWTGVSSGGVVFLNNNSQAPVYKRTGDLTFIDLPAWDGTWRTRVIRTYKDFVVALNVTKGATAYPNMVKWSDTRLYGAAPVSWDETDQTTNAGEATLSDLGAEIVDGQPLRDSFAIYTFDGIYIMDLVGGPLIFNFRKLYDDVGAIATNCVVEVEGVHYVFGPSDIYMFDGTTRKSIAVGRVKDYIFSRIDRDALENSFVVHDAKRSEVLFCYRSVDQSVKYTNGAACNEAAVYNYAFNTWSFVDLPNVTAGVPGQTLQDYTYDQATSDSLLYSDTPGSYSSMGRESNLTLYYTSKADSVDLTSNRLTVLDDIVQPRVTYQIPTELETSFYAAREGIDLDELSNLRDRKWIRALYPQCFVHNDTDGSLTFEIGSAPYAHGISRYSTSRSFNSRSEYKLDTRENGRYLAWKVSGDGVLDMEFSGMDVEVLPISRR